MDLSIFRSEPYKSFRHSLRAFISTEIAPKCAQWESQGIFPNTYLKLFGDRGFLGLSLPHKVGGQEKDFWFEVILAEELAYAGALGWALSILVQSNMIAPLIFQLGSDEQHERVLKPALGGEFYLALAATEPESGSDLASIRTHAELCEDQFIISGEKRYITNGSTAGYIITLASTSSSSGIWSLGLFIVPGDAKGVSRHRLQTVGLRSADTAAIRFDRCAIPKENLLGEQHRGFLYLLQGLQRERLICAVALNSLALRIWNETVDFLQRRSRFGGPLSEKQSIRHKLAELRATIEASRQFTYAVCAAFGNDSSVDPEILMLKIFTYESCQNTIKECLQLHGGDGFMKDHWLSQAHLDSQAFTIAAGASGVVRDLLAGLLKI